MKKTFALSIAFLISASAFAQTVPLPGVSTTIIGGGTNKVTSLSTGAFYTVNCPDVTDIDIFADIKYLNAVGAGDVNSIRMDLYRGVDSSTFESNAWQSVTLVANATTTTANSTNFNLTVASVPYLRFRLANVSTNAHATNITVSVRPKRILYKVSN